MKEPKDTGYRCIHLIYCYYSDKNDRFNGLKIEIQVRTKIQHAWATAVETIDTFTKQSLKTNNGQDDWRRFFVLMSSYMALTEKTALVPNTPTNKNSLKVELKEYAKRLRVEEILGVLGNTIQFFEKKLDPKDHFILLILDTDNKTAEYAGYLKSELKNAMNHYLIQEREAIGANKNVVLVSADSMTGLRKAYPNYFLDTKLFLQLLENALK